MTAEVSSMHSTGGPGRDRGADGGNGLCQRKTTRIAGSDFPHEIVRSRFLKLDNSHIEFVMDCLQKNTTEIRNMKQYLLTVLFNAPTTISNHYTSQVNHDLYGGW